MDKWREELRQALEAPQPIQKREFLRTLTLPQMSMQRFLASQIGYIRKRVWCVSVVIFVTAVLGYTFIPDTVLWMISGMTPLLALTIVSESGRSELYHMAELEMSTRFSLKSVILARLGILGLVNLLLLGSLLPIGIWSRTAEPIAAALYMITPFLLTTFIGLFIVRSFRGQEAMYACVGVSVGISISMLLSRNVLPFIYQRQYLMIWVIAAVALLFGTGKQCMNMIRQEELAWSLF